MLQLQYQNFRRSLGVAVKKDRHSKAGAISCLWKEHGIINNIISGVTWPQEYNIHLKTVLYRITSDDCFWNNILGFILQFILLNQDDWALLPLTAVRLNAGHWSSAATMGKPSWPDFLVIVFKVLYSMLQHYYCHHHVDRFLERKGFKMTGASNKQESERQLTKGEWVSLLRGKRRSTLIWLGCSTCLNSSVSFNSRNVHFHKRNMTPRNRWLRGIHIYWPGKILLGNTWNCTLQNWLWIKTYWIGSTVVFPPLPLSNCEIECDTL